MPTACQYSGRRTNNSLIDWLIEMKKPENILDKALNYLNYQKEIFGDFSMSITDSESATHNEKSPLEESEFEELNGN